MTQIRIKISGKVQGIGFRYFVLEGAQELGITGWVKNTSEGTVEALLQGEKNKVEKLIGLCKNGPAMARVDNVEEFPSEGPLLKGFTVS